MTEQAAAGPEESVDVVVLGGGAAGLSAALVLARARRSVVVIDAGEPRNAPAAGVHGFLSRDGVAPAELVGAGRREVEGYGGRVLDARATDVRRTESGFAVELADGRMLGARRLLACTGLVDELPDIPGVRERWGRDVLHCPYCHGWEVRDQAVGILATGPMAVHQALLFRQLTADLVLFLHTGPQPSAEQTEQFAARGIRVVSGKVAGLELTDDRLTGVRLSDGTVVARQAVVVGPRLVARAQLLAGLGLTPVEHPLGIGQHIAADATGRTEVAGVWVAGNLADLSAQVITAAAGGLAAAAAINADLIIEETQQAVTAHRDHPHHHDAGAGMPGTDAQQFWDTHYGSHERLWSGKPNRYLVSEVSELQPGSALDAGCGEGADAIWLAEQGWQVVGVDVSTVALGRAAAAADARVAERLDWQQADLADLDPGSARYDLVTSHYLHLPAEQRVPLFDRLAGAVRPGGSLLIVGHHPSDLQTTIGRPKEPEMFFTGDDIAARLDPALWEIVTNAAPGRDATDSDGNTVTIHDSVLRARRRE